MVVDHNTNYSKSLKMQKSYDSYLVVEISMVTLNIESNLV